MIPSSGRCPCGLKSPSNAPKVAKRVGDIPEGKRTTVAHGNSIYELNFDGANAIIDEWIKYAGGINAAAEGMTGNLQTISMEQVRKAAVS